MIVQTDAEEIAALRAELVVYNTAKWFEIRIIEKARIATLSQNEKIEDLEEQVNTLLDELQVLTQSNLHGKRLIEMAISFMAGAESIEAMQTALNDGTLTNYLNDVKDSLNKPIPSLDKLKN
ncbi:hypothetical protein ADIARSV_0144 [Arcticibacter svalbardensis MN12-7]|uniref:Uncharacterized protein n=1 Tax=Arcticibacter svalbardensis MN12-7 TaxID=1150600 RepID=R9GYA9_9SPHI|nr:hypothetical protein [Arcticibacter svalbardensis]EOR96721.1 hypothetical protein ADIARSV_0144 [Arcticibacter svalbardensis MN12-7]